MANPIIYGPGYSTFVRSVRLTLEEKGVPYQLEEIDFLGSGMPPEHLRRHPFGKVPAFAHDGFELYESSAIVAYVDEAFPGTSLQPGDPQARARMRQIIGIIDHYAYQAMIHQVLVPSVLAPSNGAPRDEEIIQRGLATATTSLDALEGFLGDRSFLVGDALSLADLYLTPVLAYFRMAPEGADLLSTKTGISTWYATMRKRPSVERYCPEALTSP